MPNGFIPRLALSMLLFAFMFLHSAIGWALSPGGDPDGGFDIIVIAGQSNAVGMGRDVKPIDPAMAGLCDRVCQMPRPEMTGIRSNGLPVAAVDPLQHVIWAPGRIGFATTWGAAYGATLPSDRKVLIVPCAMGGTSVLQWLDPRRPLPHPVSPGFQGLYRDCVNRTLTALRLPGNNRLIAFAWQQGEADILAAAYGRDSAMRTSEHYRSALRELLHHFRRDLPGAYPILVGEPLRSWAPRPPRGQTAGDMALLKASFVTAMHAVVRADGNARIVSSYGLTSNADLLGGADTLHFNAPSQRILGFRYFAALDRHPLH
jgi:hypothetical protein